MSRLLRLALVVVGLAAAVYGAASLTGGWLGTPPWWERKPSMLEAELEWYGGGAMNGPPKPWNPTMRPREGRERVSGAVVAVGLGLIAFGAWPRRRTLRMASTALGLAAIVYGAASLTGGWLGAPPWWEGESNYVFDDEGDVVGPAPAGSIPGTYTWPRPGREWISGGVVAVGLGLVAFGAWPRGRRPAPAS